ncbi:helix-turn-helix transcriptional regulator [Novosphingobium sp. BL-52-GroH]|uniref:helix-turn-helix transcriptional regulator n=1 Tax=Novosphingobium sp. BL-52-GroH TaxID=3349877 RepID=UPI00384D4405
MSYGEALKKWRESSDMTQAELAGAIDAHPQYVSDIERGVRRPGMRVALSIRRVTDGEVGLDLLDEAA